MLALLLLLVAATAEVKGTDAPGTVEPPSVRIISPVHGAVLREHHVSVHAEVHLLCLRVLRTCASVHTRNNIRVVALMIDADMHGGMPDAHTPLCTCARICTPLCTCARICTHAGESCSQTHAQGFETRWNQCVKYFANALYFLSIHTISSLIL